MPANRGRLTMADEPEREGLPQAVVTRKKRLRISIIWIIPLLAALVGSVTGRSPVRQAAK